MKVQKIVSLDEETAPIAQTMANFSGWVRKMLKLHSDGFDLVEVEEKRVLWFKVARDLAGDEETLWTAVKKRKEMEE